MHLPREAHAVASHRSSTWPRGPMDKASAYGAGDCRFESCRGHYCMIVSGHQCMAGRAHAQLRPATPMHQSLKGTWCSGITSAPHAEGPGFKSQCVHVHNIVRAHMCRCVPRGRSKAIGARPRLGAALDHCPSIQLCICPGKHTQWHHTQAARGPVAQWIRHRPTEPGIAGSSPAGVMKLLLRCAQ